MVSTHEGHASAVGAAPEEHQLVYALDFHVGEISGGGSFERSCHVGPPPEWERAGVIR